MTIEMTAPTLTRTPIRTGVEALRGLCGGQVFLAGDAEYDSARAAWSLFADQRPAAVAIPRNAAEVADVVRAAVTAGLRVAPQSTGHNAGPLALQDLSDVVIVRTSALTEVTVDPERLICRVGSGAVWLPAVEAAAAHGLSTLHGSSPDVGIAGYSLGGGAGWYARKLGLATNSLTAVEIVLADGSLVRASAAEHAELFWAVRGGGGNFGVVTALEFALFDFDQAYGGMLVWDLSQAREVLRTWAAWSVDAPDEVTTSFRILHLPPLPEIPEPMRGRSIVMIDGAVLDTDERAAEILAPLRALAPMMDTFARVPSAGLVRMHMDPEGPTPVASDTLMLAALPDEAIDTIVDAMADRTQSTLMVTELRQLGGALGRPHAGGGALSHFNGQFLLFALGVPMTPADVVHIEADALNLVGALTPWASGSAYLNFVETSTDAKTAFPGQVWEQLRAIRQLIDPDAVFVANHAIPRLSEAARRAR